LKNSQKGTKETGISISFYSNLQADKFVTQKMFHLQNPFAGILEMNS